MKPTKPVKSLKTSTTTLEAPEERNSESTELEVPDISQMGIDGDEAEAFIAQKRIGARIRDLRLKKSMGLLELGRHTGLSASFLSQLETGRVVPTLRNLARIAMVFSKDLSFFFESEPATIFRPHLAKDRLRLPQSGVDDPMYFFESLGYQVPDRQMDPYLAIFQPTAGRTPRTHHHAGAEFLYVLEGTLTVHHGDTVQNFGPGDAVYFDASTLHSYACEGDTPATALIVTLAQQSPALSPGAANNLNSANNRFGSVPLHLRNRAATLKRSHV